MTARGRAYDRSKALGRKRPSQTHAGGAAQPNLCVSSGLGLSGLAKPGPGEWNLGLYMNVSGEPVLNEERQPIFNAPWPSVVATLVIIVGYLIQTFFPQDWVLRNFAFSSAALDAGRWPTLFTAIFLHGSWAHALMNAGGALAFGTPVARYFGASIKGALVFLVFYLVCGGLASLGYGMANPGSTVFMVGASGAVAGLVGAAARLMAGEGVPGKYMSPIVISMSIGWIAVNLLLALAGFAPGLGNAGVAWEAHIFGYIAGLVLIGPFGWASRSPAA